MEQTASYQILHKFFELKKQRNPAFSMRALARDLDVSPSYASRLLKGEKRLPEKRIEDVIRIFEIDEIGENELRLAMAVEKHPEETAKMFQRSFEQAERGQLSGSSFKTIDQRSHPLLDEWFYLAILDLSTCENFIPDSHWIAEKLELEVAKVEAAVEKLFRLGYLVEENGRWMKFDKMIRFPARQSRQQIRKFHTKMMEKSVKNMNLKTSDEDYARRLLAGGTVAANPEKMDEARRILNEAMHRAIEVLSEGDCSEVYHVGVLLNPLTCED